MSKKHRREAAVSAAAKSIAATAMKLDEVLRDPQQIAAAMEDTIDVVSEDVPHAHDVTETVPGVEGERPDDADPGEQVGASGLQAIAGRDVAGKPSTVHLEDAMARWGLVPADVLAWRGFVPEVESVLVTAGGQKLRWPDDEARVLTEADKGRAVYTPAHPGGYLRRRV